MDITPSPTAEDLRYVKRALERDERSPFPFSIALLWAVICGIGFPVNDLAPGRAGLFWSVAAPLGFVLSCWLGFRSSRRAGALDRRAGRRWAGHFGALLLAALAVLAGSAFGGLSGAEAGAAMVLLTGLTYLLAGVHLSPPLAWVGGLLLAGYPLVFALGLTRWRWTAIGIATAAGLLVVSRLRPAGDDGAA